jgi:nitrogen fixation protein FixH
VLELLELRALPSVATPVANDDFTDTDGTNPVLIAVLSNDSAPAGFNTHTVHVVAAPTGGTAAVDSATGAITYDPGANFTGTDTFSYNFQDANGVTSNTARVTVVVNRPKANDDEIDTDAGNPVTIDVLANDTDPDGPGKLNPATVAVGQGPAHGTTSVNPNTGAITYTPQQGFSGTDTFTYTVTDVNGATSDPAKVTVVVNRPTANDDFAQTNMNTAVTVDILGNDTDPDGANKLDPGSVTIRGGPGHGTLSSPDPATGAVTYTPAASFFGTDTFTYTVKDVANAVSNTATVTITVKAVGVVNDDSIDTDAGNPVNIPVLANDSSPNGFNTSTLTVPTPPAHGAVTVDRVTGVINYDPVDGFSGTDTFTYTVQDNSGNNLGPAHVTVVVNRPTANDDFTDTDAGTAVTVDVLANDTDPDGPNKLDPGSVTVVTPPAHGTTSVDPGTGAITYTPQDGFSGTDTFTYTVQDVNSATSNPATVSVVVNRPTANDDSVDTDGTNPVTVDVLANDTDPDGPNKLDPAAVKVVTQPAHGSVSVNHTTGAITYTAEAGFAGTDTFTYTVKDVANATSNPATVSVIVNRPTAEDDTATAFGTSPVTIDVLANDSDPDGPDKIDPSSVTVVNQPAHGTTSVDAATGEITYTPSAGFSGVDTFTYTVKDFPGATSNVATVSVSVNPPTANPDSATTVGTKPVAVDVLANDTDPNGSLVPGSVVVTAGPSHGHVTVDPASGQITYTASRGFLGADTFTYTVADSFGSRSNPATVTVNVTQAPAPVVHRGKGHKAHSPHLLVFDPHMGSLEFNLTPYGRRFTDGIHFTLGDVNGDGVVDIVTAAAHGHRPVLVFDGQTGAVLESLRLAGLRHASRVRVAAGDVNGDGVADVLTLIGRGRKSKGEAFDGATGAPIGPLTRAAIDRFFGA